MVTMKKEKKKRVPRISSKKNFDFDIHLDEITNGTKKPVEICEVLSAMRNWRAESALSQLVIR